MFRKIWDFVTGKTARKNAELKRLEQERERNAFLNNFVTRLEEVKKNISVSPTSIRSSSKKSQTKPERRKSVDITSESDLVSAALLAYSIPGADPITHHSEGSNNWVGNGGESGGAGASASWSDNSSSHCSSSSSDYSSSSDSCSSSDSGSSSSSGGGDW